MSSESPATAPCEPVDAADGDVASASAGFAPCPAPPLGAPDAGGLSFFESEANADSYPVADGAQADDSIGLWEDCKPASDAASLPPVSATRPVRRLGDRIFFGRFAIPTVLIGWVGSVVVHAAVVAVGICIARRAIVELPRFAFVQGDGASELGIQNLGTGVPPIQIDASPTPAEDPPAQPPSARRFDPAATAGDEDYTPELPESFRPADQTPLPPVDRGDSDAVPWIGPPAADDAPQPPARTKHRGGSGGALASASPTGAASANSSENQEPGPVGVGGAPSDGGAPGVAEGDPLSAMAAPIYPLESRRRREQGVVKLELDMMPDGSVAGITVVSDGGGHPLLVQAAIDAVRRSRLPPLRQNGVPVRAHVTVPFNFFLRS